MLYKAQPSVTGSERVRAAKDATLGLASLRGGEGRNKQQLVRRNRGRGYRTAKPFPPLTVVFRSKVADVCLLPEEKPRKG